MDIAELRLQYMRQGLDEATADSDPLLLFQTWLAEAFAAGLTLPQTMTLATIGEDGRPSARSVILRSGDERGFVWVTNFESRKGRELAANPHASLLFAWAPIERQVRVDGVVERVTDAESDALYASRPLDLKLEAWASMQSLPIANRDVLEAALAVAKERYGDNPPRPAYWGGLRLHPEAFEFWQGREDRLHDRLVYTRAGGGWQILRLAP